MMKRALVLSLTLLTAACSGIERTPGDGLPFYDSADFTPRWTTSVEHRIGAFDLVTQTGEGLTAGDLDGRVHIASFIFTSCGDVCPTIVRQLSKVQTALTARPGAWLVSYSVTPEADTPQALEAFGRHQGIQPAYWKLVTGEAHQIYNLARRSYFADDGRLEAAQQASGQFLHTEKVLLVDRRGRIRGVYNGTLPYEIDKLIADLDVLLSDNS